MFGDKIAWIPRSNWLEVDRLRGIEVERETERNRKVDRGERSFRRRNSDVVTDLPLHPANHCFLLCFGAFGDEFMQS